MVATLIKQKKMLYHRRPLGTTVAAGYKAGLVCLVGTTVAAVCHVGLYSSNLTVTLMHVS